MRILLVEDDPRMSALLDRGFKEEGHVVERAASGAKALDAVGVEEFDVVVLDVMAVISLKAQPSGFASAALIRARLNGGGG